MFAFVHNNILPQVPQDEAPSPVIASIQQLYLQAVVGAQKAPDPRVPIDVTPVPDARDGATEW